MTNYEQVLNALAFILSSRKENNISRFKLETLSDDEVSEFGDDFDFGPDEYSQAIGILDEASKVW
jgi:hypothetical protein